MTKKIRSYKKSEMLYPDRGMLKWAPMLLSDHSEDMMAIRDTKDKKAKESEIRKKQREEEFPNEP